MVAPALAYAVPPPEFGRDGGEFYRHYDKIADQLDNGIVKGLKSSLDGLLIFAGLFAAINSSFLALTLPQMSANPVDDTNALLLALVRRNGTSPVTVDLPSNNFSPKPHIPLVNLLLMISLASALIAAFFAVAGKQWLANYQTLDGSGGEKQRGAQLKRSRSADHWGLVPFLDVAIPLLLQIALLIFAVGIIIYLERLDYALGYTIIGLASLATVFAVYALFVSLWDPYSPYVTPVSRFLKWSGPAILLLVIWVVVMIARLVKSLTAVAGDQPESGIVVARRARHAIKGIFPRYREGDMPVHFQADFVGRILTISVDREAVFYAALNIQLVHDLKAIQLVSQDGAIATRFRDMFLDMTRRGVGTRVSKAPSIRAGGDTIAFGGAHLQLVLYESAVVAAGWSGDGQSAEEMFQSSEGLAGVLVKGKRALNVELPASCHVMMWLFEAWFGSKSLVQQLRLQTSEISPPPLSIQTAGFIAFAISASAELLETPATQSFPAWALSIFPSIRNLFWKCRVDEDLIEIVSSALHTFTFTGHWHREQRPSYQVYIALLRAVTAQLRKANRYDEHYLEGIVKKALLILRPLEQQLRDPEHGLNALELIIVRALRAAAVEIIEACFARAVFRLRDDSYRGGAGQDDMYLHRSTIWLALGSLTEYLRFITATTGQEDDENAVALNNLQNAAVMPLVGPLANFIQQVTAPLDAPRFPEEHRLYQVITRDFMPAYAAFRALIGAVPVSQRSLFTDIFKWRGIHTDERRQVVEQSLERQLRKAIAIDTFEE